MENRTVTSSMTSRDLERSRSWPQYVCGPFLIPYPSKRFVAICAPSLLPYIPTALSSPPFPPSLPLSFFPASFLPPYPFPFPTTSSLPTRFLFTFQPFPPPLFLASFLTLRPSLSRVPLNPAGGLLYEFLHSGYMDCLSASDISVLYGMIRLISERTRCDNAT